MKNLRTERKVIVEKQDHYSVHLEGDSTYYSPKTKEEADELKKQLEQQEKEKVKECNDRELREIETNKIIRRELDVELQHLVNIQRSETDEGRKNLAKELRQRLKNIIYYSEEQANKTIGYHGAV